MSITNPSQLLSLLTLSSTALPIGAYCYSQGVESAIDRGLIHDEASSIAYFEEVLEMLLVRFELPVLKRLMQYSDDEEKKYSDILAFFHPGSPTLNPIPNRTLNPYKIKSLLKKTRLHFSLLRA